MLKPVAVLLLTWLPLAAQENGSRDSQKMFLGTWEARYKDRVICTIRLRAGDPISGETSACSINVDENGDLKEPETMPSDGDPSPVLKARVSGKTLSFEEHEGDEAIRFEMKITGEGRAELKILDAPMVMKPIAFTRKEP